MRKIFCLSVMFVLAASISAAQMDDISGSTVTYDGFTYNGPTDVDLFFTVTHQTTDAEWPDAVTITLPAPWTVVSLTAGDFDITSGVGTAVAKATDSGYPCSGFGKDCSAGCAVTVKIDPAGQMTAGAVVTWMIEGDRWGSNPPAVVCSAGDACSYDACYTGLGIDQSGADLNVGTVPVELMSISIE